MPINAEQIRLEVSVRSEGVAAFPTVVSFGRRFLKVTKVFWTYWKFAAERQSIFFRRLSDPLPWTNDPILTKFKFTNAYRASDRVSQYLIKNVAYTGEQSPSELF